MRIGVARACAWVWLGHASEAICLVAGTRGGSSGRAGSTRGDSSGRAGSQPNGAGRGCRSRIKGRAVGAGSRAGL